METLIAWCGFLGAWLLFAGPIFQAALELQEEGQQTDLIEAKQTALAGQFPRVSPWWWLLPPVYYVLARRRSRRFREAVVAALTPVEIEVMLSYINKATGWLLVAAGALFIAVKETGELVEHLHWPVVVFVVLVLDMAALATLHTAARMGMTRHATTQPSPGHAA